MGYKLCKEPRKWKVIAMARRQLNLIIRKNLNMITHSSQTIKNTLSKEKNYSLLKISPKLPPHLKDSNSNHTFKENALRRKAIIQKNKKIINQINQKSLRNMNRLFNTIKSIQHILKRICAHV